MKDWMRALLCLVAVVTLLLFQEGAWTLKAKPGDINAPIPIQKFKPPPIDTPQQQLINDDDDSQHSQLNNFNDISDEENNPPQTEKSFHTPHTINLDRNLDIHHSKTAIVSIAVGKKACHFARFLVVSFLRNSDFYGPLYIITDRPDFFDDLIFERKLHPHSEVRFIKVTLDGEGSGTVGDLTIPTVPDQVIIKENKYGIINWVRFSEYKRMRLQIKWLKSKLFTLIPEEFEQIIFMDSDILIGTNMNAFLRHCLAELKSPRKIALFTDIGHTGSLYHTGVVMFHRERSAPLIAEWGRNIRNGTYGSDQRAIEAAIQTLGIADDVGFLSVDEEDAFFCFIDGKVIKARKPFTFIHATFYRLTTGEKFGFTNETAKRYFERTINTPWQEWTGEWQPHIEPKWTNDVAAE